jgi:chromatin remodeling complex protein RSC6
MAPAKTTKTKTVTPTPSESVETKKSTTTTKETAQKTTTKATKAQKVTKPSKEEVKSSVKEVVPTPPVTEVQNVVVQVDTESSVSDGFSDFFTKFQAMISQFGSLKTELKQLERRTVKQLKVVQKINNKKRKKGVRAPSGFVKPSPISEELATFLGKEKGVEMARTDVTREINKYIRAHDLQDKENGRKINPDQPLRTLLKLDNEPDVVLTYFNLQRYMGPHFPKSTKTTESTTA